MLTDSLEALVAEHDRIGSSLRDELRSGTPREQVEAAVRELGLIPPAELVEFFAWHDVDAAPGSAGRTDWFWPVGATRFVEAVDEYRHNVALGGASPAEVGDALGPTQPPSATFTGFWRTDWFPVFGGGETYAIECPDGGGSSPGSIWRVNWHPDPEFQTVRVAASLTEFVDRGVELFRAGAYTWSAEYHTVMTVDEVFVRLGLGTLFRPWP